MSFTGQRHMEPRQFLTPYDHADYVARATGTLEDVAAKIMHGPIGESHISGPGESGVLASPVDGLSTTERHQRLQRILSIITDAQQVCENRELTTMTDSTRWYLSESTLGLAKVLLRSLLEQKE